MDFGIKDQWFLVGGATSGFGKAITESLIKEGARVLAIARTEANLLKLKKEYKDKIEIHALDLSDPGALHRLAQETDLTVLSGAVFNAGGPPAMRFMETNQENWDEAYRLIVRWKVELTRLLIPVFIKNNYGRLVFIESVSVKQPVENLVLSNSLRMAVVGFVKTLSQETGKNICMNILAPGYHDTPAVERVFKKRAELNGISTEEARRAMVSQIPAGKIGNPADFASLACWLLSPGANYINGQTITVDGGSVKGSFG